MFNMYKDNGELSTKGKVYMGTMLAAETIAAALGIAKGLYAQDGKQEADKAFQARNQPSYERSIEQMGIKPAGEHPVTKMMTLDGKIVYFPTESVDMDGLDARLNGDPDITKQVESVGTYDGQNSAPVGFKTVETGKYIFNPGTWQQGFGYDSDSDRTFADDYSVISFDDMRDTMKDFAGELSQTDLKGYDSSLIYAGLMNLTRAKMKDLATEVDREGNSRGQVPHFYLGENGRVLGYMGPAENVGLEQAGIEFDMNDVLYHVRIMENHRNHARQIQQN